MSDAPPRVPGHDGQPRSLSAWARTFSLVASSAVVLACGSPEHAAAPATIVVASSQADAAVDLAVVDGGVSANGDAAIADQSVDLADSVQRCKAGEYARHRGCFARKAWPVAEAYVETPTSRLEKLSRAKLGSRDVDNAQIVLSASVMLARRTKGADRALALARALDAYKIVDRWASPIPSTARELATEAEYSQIVDDIAAHSPDEAVASCPAATSADLFGTGAPAGTHAVWDLLVDKVEADSKTLDSFGRRHASDPSAWTGVARARDGLLWAHLQSKVDACVVNVSIALFTPKEAAFLRTISNSGDPDLIAKGQQVLAAKLAWFDATKKQDNDAATDIAVRILASGIAYANAMGMSRAEFAEARVQLARLRTLIGDEATRRLLAKSKDPADPENQRSLADIADGIFSTGPNL